jgi:CheY-like chemotaxis protein
MPYGNVLVVDDVDTNLYVAQGLLLPYKLDVETAASGFAALDMVNSGKIYDVIFMDHMMPQMDGIETTQKLRKLGYTGIIVALTANALTGNDKMFMQNGFDGFISKPIDLRQLNSILNKFVRDRHPEKSKKYKPETADKTIEVNPKLLQIFCNDVKKTIVTLQETIASGDIKLFTTTAHAIKSAAANVGEIKTSKLALAMENAGLNGDMNYINANTEAFIKHLKALIENLHPVEIAVTNAGIEEDSAYLTEQLQIVKAACESYDDDEAYAALDRLKEKPWNTKTTEALDQIRDALFIYSDFDGAANMAKSISTAITLSP